LKTLRVVVVDDEPLARDRLSRLLSEMGCEVFMTFRNAPSLLRWLQEGGSADALFVDVQMPGGSGLELLAERPAAPPVIFVTAHPEHAVRAFELVAFDYIVKPVFEDRLEKTLKRLREHRKDSSGPHSVIGPANQHSHRFPVKAGDGHVFLDLKRVTHFEVEHQVVWVWSAGKRFRGPWTALADVEAAFPDAGLVRIQRHILLRPEAVIGHRTLGGGRALVRVPEGIELEVSRSVTPKLREWLGLIERH
jgi:DNA-binding LytR/AlgR family response regulator